MCEPLEEKPLHYCTKFFSTPLYDCTRAYFCLYTRILSAKEKSFPYFTDGTNFAKLSVSEIMEAK